MIIGLSGQAGCGKDTCADFLVEHHGFVKVALADPIKRAAMEWWDFTEEQLWGSSEERNKPDKRYMRPTPAHIQRRIQQDVSEYVVNGDGRPDDEFYLTPRHALQQIGTEVGRAIDSDVWVRYTMNVAERLLGSEGRRSYNRTKGVFDNRDSSGRLFRCEVKGVVISDCRFKNEFAVIRKAGGQLVRINRPGAGLNGKGAQHASEAEQREVPDMFFDFVLRNAGSLHELKLGVDSMLAAAAGRMKKYDANGDDDIPPFKRV